jgi:hypothetical protein
MLKKNEALGAGCPRLAFRAPGQIPKIPPLLVSHLAKRPGGAVLDKVLVDLLAHPDWRYLQI